MSKIFMVVNKLNPDKGGGVNRAVMNRSKSLAARGYDVSILTLNDYNAEESEKKFREMGRLDKKVNLLNIYDYYQKSYTRTKITRNQMKYYKNSTKLYEKDYKVQVDKSKLSARYFKNGMYIKYKKWNKNGVLSHIDYFDEGRKRITREKFHASGFVRRKIHYDQANGKPKYIQYFTCDGFCFLNSWYTPQKKHGKHFLFDRNSQKVQFFEDDTEFCTHWLNQLCLDQGQKPYVICDKLECAQSVMDMGNDMAHRIYVIHSNHFKYSFELGSPIKTMHQIILNNLKKLDHVVVFTDNQKQDIIDEFNDYGNVSVIPHSIHGVSNKKIRKDNKTVSVVARLTSTKRVAHAIEAFQQVVMEVPEAMLEIHGAGVLEDELKDKINTLNLDQNVFLKGYTSDTDLIYKKSLATLLTSKYEAFSLVIMESMANGTPVISYDVNYGPRDMITNGVDGYLIRQDKQILADKIIDLLKNPKKARGMGKKAKKNIYRNFNEQKIIDQWIHLFNDLKK